MAEARSGYPTRIDLDPGTVIDGRYAVDRLVGRGGMADVVRADDLVRGEPVAVKILRACDRQSLARYRTEIEVLRRLDHPAVVRLRGWGAHLDQPYLVLDLAEGPTLATRLAQGGPVDEATSIATGVRLAEALAYAHGLGVVHRDVKPSNVLLDGDPLRPRLADFDIARLACDAQRTAGTGIGTAAYVAPEQLDGDGGPPSDVYALGLVLIECLTGEVCFPGSMTEAALARLRRPPAVPTDLPPWLQHVLVAMTDRSAERRPPAGAVAAALRAGSADPLHPLPVLAGPPPPRPPSPPRPVPVPAPVRHDTATLPRLPDSHMPVSALVALATTAVAVLILATMVAFVALQGPEQTPAPTPAVRAQPRVPLDKFTDRLADPLLPPTTSTM